MSSSPYEFATAEIGVFWDIVDCPVPDDLCPKSIFLNIKSALEKIGYLGKLSISAYSDMDQNPEDFESTGITLLPTGDKRARVNEILGDLLLWSVDRKRIPFNLLIISREITDDRLYVRSLIFWKDRTGNILLAQPERLANDDLSDCLLRHTTAVWFWKNLSYGGKPIFNIFTRHGREQVVSQRIPNKRTCSLSKGKSTVQGESSIVKVKTTNYRKDYTKNIKDDESSSTHIEDAWKVEIMSSSANEFAAAEIGVFWDIVDCPLPDDLCPKSIFLKIKSALEEIGYVGKVSISAYSDMDQNPEDFESTGITLLPTGNKYVRINEMLGDLTLFAVDQKPKPYNLLIISREITKDKLYVKTLRFLKLWNGNILLAQPESLAHDDLSDSLLREVTAVWLWNSLSYGGKSIFHRGSSQTSHESSQVVSPRLANMWS